MSANRKKKITAGTQHTFSQEVLEILDGGLFNFVIRRIAPDERKHIVGQDIGVGIGAVCGAKQTRLAGF